MDRRVAIVEPTASWPNEFEPIADAVRYELGALALRIDHIGSTSVPDLPAKDVIDIQLTWARSIVTASFPRSRAPVSWNRPLGRITGPRRRGPG